MKAIRDVGIRTFEMIQYLSGPLPPVEKVDDLSPQMQDALMLALERKSQEVHLPLAIVALRCDVDYDKPDDDPHRYYLHVIASEIVAGPSIKDTKH